MGKQSKHLARRLGRKTYQKLVGVRKDLEPRLWGLDYRDQGLSLYGIKLDSILEKFGSPIHVLNIPQLKKNARAMIFGHNDQQILTAYFSYKTHSIPGILKLLHEKNFGAEVISYFELWLALKLNIRSNRIIFNGPAKSDESLGIAIDREIRLINVNHKEELVRISKIARKLGKKANLGIRLALPDGRSGQFGLDPYLEETLTIFRETLKRPEFNLVGIHCHRGSLFESLADLGSYLEQVIQMVDHLYGETGFHPEILDVGGGFGIKTVRSFSSFEKSFGVSLRLEPIQPDPTTKPKLEDFADLVSSTFRRHFREVDRPVPELAVEPGRAITGNSQILLSTVVEVKDTSEGIAYAILDAGVSVANIVTTEFHQVFPLKSDTGRPARLYRLVGPLCHTGDIMYSAWTIPELMAGDSIAIMDSGAYFDSDARAFSFPRPGIVGLSPEMDPYVIRDSDTFDHLISRDRIIGENLE